MVTQFTSIDRQAKAIVDQASQGYRVSFRGCEYQLKTLEKVYQFFFKQCDVDTIKIYQDEKKCYVHFSAECIEVYKNRKSLRKALSWESGGAWIEMKEGKRRYFVDQNGWWNSSYREVDESAFLHSQYSPLLQKVTGIGLGIFSLASGIIGASWQHRSLLRFSGSALLVSHVNAQSDSEFQINTFTAGFQRKSSVVEFSSEKLVVVWESEDQDVDSIGIFGQILSTTGQMIGREFQINTYMTSEQQSPKVAAIAPDGFVVVWESNGQDGSSFGIYAQEFAFSGLPLFGEFQVNSYLPLFQVNPQVAPLPSNGYLVVWSSNNQDGDSLGIFGQRYLSSLTPVGTEFQVNNFTVGIQSGPDVARLNGVGSVIVWQSFGQDGDQGGIYGQRYALSGAAVGGEFRVNFFTNSSQIAPRVSGLLSGGFVVVWQSQDQDGNLFGIYGKQYDETGSALGSEFQVNTVTQGSQSTPCVAGLSDGGYVIVWNSFNQDGDLGGIFAQKYLDDGALFGEEFRVNDHTEGNQAHPDVASTREGGFIVTWSSDGQDGSGFGIYGKIFDRDGNPINITRIDQNSTSSFIFSSSQENSMRSSDSQTFNSTVTSTSFLQSVSSRETSPLSSTETMISSSLTSAEISTQESSLYVAILYAESYSITLGGEIVGTYTFSGGSGEVNPGNVNTMTVQFDSNFSPDEGDVITLFTFAADQAGLWSDLIVETEDFECLDVRGDVTEGTTSNIQEYQLIFEHADSCITFAPQLEHFLPTIMLS